MRMDMCIGMCIDMCLGMCMDGLGETAAMCAQTFAYKCAGLYCVQINAGVLTCVRACVHARARACVSSQISGAESSILPKPI